MNEPQIRVTSIWGLAFKSSYVPRAQYGLSRAEVFERNAKREEGSMPEGEQRNVREAQSSLEKSRGHSRKSDPASHRLNGGRESAVTISGYTASP